MNSIILYFHFQELVFEYPLPAGNDKRVPLDLGKAIGGGSDIVNFEIWDHTWHLLSGNDVVFSINGKQIDDIVLDGGAMINGMINKSGAVFTIVVKVLDAEASLFKKFSLKGTNNVTIGKDGGSDIVINDMYTSKRHAVLHNSGDGHILSDCDSTNGIYVNNRRITGSVHLQVMDVIYITGVKLVYFGEFLAINHMSAVKTTLQTYTPPETGERIPAKDVALIRSPRLIEPLDKERIEIEAPPNSQRRKKSPLIFTIGPAATMPLPILTSILLNSSRSSGGNFYLGTIISVGLSALFGVIWALAHYFYDKREATADEAHRTDSYINYIAKNDRLLNEKHQKNAGILSSQHLHLQELSSLLNHNTSVLWNRNVNQQDFLSVRLGLGPVKFHGEIVVPKQRFSLSDDALDDEPVRLLNKYRNINETVSLFKMGDTKIVGVIGDEKAVSELARVIALQTAALHCYTDVKMAFIMQPDEVNGFSWARLLPHVRSYDNKLRMLCANETERQNVLFYLNGILRSRKEHQQELNRKEKRQLPHYIIFCTSPELIASESIYQYMVDEGDYGITFVLLYGVLDKLPNECVHIIQNDGDFSGYYRMDEARDETNNINFDSFSHADSEYLARKIGGYYITEQATGEIPASISFLEMYGISDVNQWDLLKRWKENRAYESMRALMGIGTGGKRLYLDIHEKQHGPHGLMAGTTGSGKSETIQTYILSLAMNYHPHEIALILIDYKGGGMANAFLKLPHLAGTITNLDGNQTIRALVSIKAEIKRRQALFNQYNVNHIDLYARLFREGKAIEPMPHLIIISDEFAELKKEQPEFIKELVSTARVGRSLGIHLILATQKPSGVVDDEIWSNSRFKICLRVQDKQDSQEMLKRPDAAYLTNTGRAYMQIGNDEIFEMFQSGYSGARYDPDELSSGNHENEVAMISLDGTAILIKSSKKHGGDDRITQLDACVEFIRGVADASRIKKVRGLWLPELQEGMTIQDVKAHYSVPSGKGLFALFGILDNPAAQTQEGLAVDFHQTGNLLIAGIPSSGKSTLLQTMLYSLVTSYSSKEVIFYCMDFSGTLMRVFENLPHCGGVVGSNDPERTSRLFNLLREIIEYRRRLFDKASVGGFDEYKKLPAGEVLPSVLLVLDNYYAFASRYPESEDEIEELSRNGSRYGIHLVVTVNHLNDMKYKIRQNFNTTLPLLLSERSDYMEALGVMPEFTPPNRKGRGLYGPGALEYQTVFASFGESERDRAEKMRLTFETLPEEDYRAPAIRFIDKEQDYAGFLESEAVRDVMRKELCICIGYDMADISVAALSLRDVYCYSISGATSKAIENMMRNMIEAGKFLKAELHMVCLRSDALAGEECEGLYRDGDSVFSLLVKLKEEFTSRSAMRKEMQQSSADGDYFTRIRQERGLIFVFIDSMNSFCDLAYDKNKEDFSPIIEEFFKKGKGLGIYFIAGFETSIYSSNIYKPVCKHFIDHKTGLHLGGKLDQQKLFEAAIPMTEQMKPRDITIGYTTEDNLPKSVFVPLHRNSKL